MAPLLSSCATLPASGPTASQIRKQLSAQGQSGIPIIEITQSVIDQQPGQSIGNALKSLTEFTPPFQNDVIHNGDSLAIDIYEVGYALFGGIGADSRTDNSPARAQRVVTKVDEHGVARLPYAGFVEVAGLTPIEAARRIESHFRGLSQYPQVVVSISDSVGNSVYISGAIAKPGRYPLTTAREHVLDMIAIAGGPSVDTDDVELRVVRGSDSAAVTLGDLHPQLDNNIQLAPGDRLELVKKPRTFTVMGASDRVNQLPFGPGPLYLSEAVARSGGPADTRANPKGVFIFRYEINGNGVQVPVIYSLNLMAVQSYFLSQRFVMRDKDVLYLANSSANAPMKFINMINQLFGPAVTARALTN